MDFVTLPSNASQDVFKNNTNYSFCINLVQNIDLEGLWQVASMESSYSHTWFNNVPQEMAIFDWQRKPTEQRAGVDLAEDTTKGLEDVITLTLSRLG